MYGNVAIIMGKSKLKLFGLEILVSFEILTHAHPDSVAHCFTVVDPSVGILPLTPEVALVTTWSTELLQIADR
jgi:hypothetical protein